MRFENRNKNITFLFGIKECFRKSEDVGTSVNQSEKRFTEFSPLKKLKFQSNKNGDPTQDDPTVMKVINFVAIKSKKIEPDYKPRNKIIVQKPKIEHIDIPTRQTKKRPKSPLLPQTKTHQISQEIVDFDETYELDEFEPDDLYKAEIKDDSQLIEAKVKMTETKFLYPKTPPKSNTLKFSEYKRNCVTDSLFAGNIYVGNEVENETDLEDTKVEKKEYTSWRSSFRDKMDS